MKRSSAMMSSPYRDAARVEQMAHIVRMNSLPVRSGECEGNGTAAINGLGWS
jgi:hypothetical protein